MTSSSSRQGAHHAAGNQEDHIPPEIMIKYRSGGTPWTVIIAPEGEVVFNDFHLEADSAAALIEDLLSHWAD